MLFVDLFQDSEYTNTESHSKWLIMTKTTVTLRERNLANGTVGLYMDIYAGTVAELDPKSGKIKYKGNRIRKTTGLTLVANPKNTRDRQANKNTLRLAKEMCRAEEMRILSTNNSDIKAVDREIDFYEFYEDFISEYPKKDIRQVRRALVQFRAYLESTRRFRHLKNKLEFNSITKSMVEGYAEYLKQKFTGEGPHTVFARFKKVVRRAIEEGYITKDPCVGITISCNQGQVVKETLTMEEIELLVKTNFKGENPEVRRAFLFSLFTGIRWCDVRVLTFNNVSDGILRFNQRKTEGHSSASLVSIPLTDILIRLIDQPKDGNKESLIFNLPSDTTSNHKLKMWMKAAGINKHITWHCARHSFGTNLCEKGINPMTIMNLMGHSSLKYTNVYVRVRDKKKAEAMDVLSSDIQLQ